MAAKEPTVETGQRAYEAWMTAYFGEKWQGHHDTWGELEAKQRESWAAAEQAAAERAWDEGFDEGLMRPRGAVNPYRLPKGPTK